jgi:hypothetical protein
MTKHEEAMAYLNIKFCFASTKSEENLIKYIQEILIESNKVT